METITLEVTQEDIDNATRYDSDHCVINTALQRQFGDGALVGFRTFYLDYINDHGYYTTPELRQYIAAWDNGDEVFPTTFQIDLVADV